MTNYDVMLTNILVKKNIYNYHIENKQLFFESLYE